jgi:hypothetical protein
MRITKKTIDELAALEQAVQAAKAALKAATTLYEQALGPVLEHVNSKAGDDQRLELTGATSVIEFGPKARKRTLVNAWAAVQQLEAVQPGLGTGSISVPLSVLDEYLRPDEMSGLLTETRGGRSVRVVVTGSAPA